MKAEGVIRNAILVWAATVFAVAALFTIWPPHHISVPPVKTVYCHACRCGKEAAQCLKECNSPRICVVMCADKCNFKKMTSESGASPELEQEFQEVNVRFFGGALPNTHVSLSNQREDDWIGITAKCGKGEYCITIDTKLAPAPRERDWILMHEICHVATYDVNEAAHGEQWQECMVGLADKGAFTGIW